MRNTKQKKQKREQQQQQRKRKPIDSNITINNKLKRGKKNSSTFHVYNKHCNKTMLMKYTQYMYSLHTQIKTNKSPNDDRKISFQRTSENVAHGM